MQAKDSFFNLYISGSRNYIHIPGVTLLEIGDSFGASLGMNWGGEAIGVMGWTEGEFPGKSFTGIVVGAEEESKSH